MTRHTAFLGLATASMLAAAATMRIQPSSYDFGKEVTHGGAKATSFAISVTGGGTVLTATISGPDVADFKLGTATGCGPTSNSCTLAVSFKPQSVGVKNATLTLDDGKGNSAQASLRGTGIAPVCTNNVVFCNYAFLYSGNFDWTTASETVRVTVVDGVATCNGSVTLQGRPRGSVNGTGLIGVEFVRGSITDSLGNEGPERLVHRVTVAWRSPFVPATADAAALPSRPAELGDFFKTTYNQPAIKTPMDSLTGSTSYPLEGEGTVSVTWTLRRR